MVDQTRNKDFSYFGIQAMWGTTKHLGGRRATDRLVELCVITPGSTVLEIGCGVGVTACHLARTVGCAVSSVDVSEAMVAWARRRAERDGMTDRIAFSVADARALPFRDNSFDAVISESVTAFVSDRKQAVREYERVLKSGGRVGMAEGSWVRSPPPAHLVEFLSRSMQGAVFLEPDGWLELLEEGNFVDVRGETFGLTALDQLASDLSGLSRHDLADRFRALGSFVGRYLTDAEMRRYVRTLVPSRHTMTDLFTYFGYGIYTARKRP